MKQQICHVLFPGAFKPVHAGHIQLMQKYLSGTPEYAVDLTILISKLPREGVEAESTKWFLEQVFKGNLNVHVRIAPDNSPIKSVYDIIGQASLGEGIYAMGTSAKGDDIRRAEDIVNKFAPDGKYYTPGVKVIFFPVNVEPLTYTNRKGDFSNVPISSTIVRNDIRDNNYEMFRTSYLPLLEQHLIDEEVVRKYFQMLSKQVLPASKTLINSSLTESLDYALFEGGAAGHMPHPYDIPDFTFKDLENLIEDLFAGKITDITEKLDGQNLFASVDLHGNTIFARKESDLYMEPWYLGDIMNNPKWEGKPSVQHAFTNAALTVDKIFKNIDNPTGFFNNDDKADGVRYRYWVNLEIIDTQNFNVIPYADSKVSFHNFVLTIFDYSKTDKFSSDKNAWSKMDLQYTTQKILKDELQKAIDKTNRTTFKAQITPQVIFRKYADGKKKAEHYISMITNLLSISNLSDNTTIEDYRKESLIRYLEGSNMSWIDNEVLTVLLERWTTGKGKGIRDIAKTCRLSNGNLMTSEQYSQIREFETTKKDEVIKKIMKPLDTLFIKLGNEVLKHIEGLANAGHEQEVLSKLKSEMKDIENGVRESDNEKNKEKLRRALSRLSEVNNELNSSEGIVFKYNDRIMKLTGSFAPLNQLFGLKNFKR